MVRQQSLWRQRQHHQLVTTRPQLQQGLGSSSTTTVDDLSGGVNEQRLNMTSGAQATHQKRVAQRGPCIQLVICHQ